MIVSNKLTRPGDIRRIDLAPDTVRIQTSDGHDRIYRLASEYSACAELKQNEDNLPIRS